MKKLLDLRFVIGIFFTVVGLLLCVYHFTGMANTALNTSVNMVCGILFMLFGICMIALSHFHKMTGDSNE